MGGERFDKDRFDRFCCQTQAPMVPVNTEAEKGNPMVGTEREAHETNDVA